MQLEVGAVVEGSVTGITNFGAFVELGGGKTGLVHISEISNTFVKEVRDYLKEGEKVKVKVINISPNGKVELSIKRTKTDSDNKTSNLMKEEVTSKSAASTSSRFEDMISKFKRLSDEKLSNFSKKTESRRPRCMHKNNQGH